MTVGGWIFMVASWAVILALFAFSMARTLRTRGPADEFDTLDGTPPKP